MRFQSLSCWCEHRVTELGELSSVSEVGLGLFLALAIVQVIGSGGVSRLRRKAGHLTEVVRTNRIGSERASTARVEADLLRLELSLERLSNLFFGISFFLISVSVAGVAIVALAPEIRLGCVGTALFTAFYLALPLVAFLAASGVIRRKCRAVRRQILAVEDRIISKL